MKKDFREEAGACVSKLSLEEKAALGTGADFWRTQAFPEAGIPALTMSDGPSGLRYQKPGTPAKGMIVSEPATCFPALATVAASWDEELVERMGEAIGTEAKDLGVDVVLGPGLNIKRSPLCGRNFEYFSEDPYLAGKLGVSYVRGVQSTGTGSCIKHFAVNSQEYKRFSNDCIIDERTLREIYLKAFEMVVREAAPEMVMGAYVMLNGIYCSDNAHLLREILRDEWGFEGAVTTDWGGMHDRVRAYEAGCDLAMPGPAKHLAKQAARAAGQGKLDERRIDEAAERLCALALRHAAQAKPAKPLDIAASRRIARQVAAEGQVLLKNDGALPLAKGASVALIGEMAAKPRYQGGGSSHINARKVSNIHSVRPEWTYAAGYDARTGATTPELLAEAKEAARAAAVSVVVIGLPETIESEGYDRSDMRLPEGMDELVETVAAVSARTVVVLQCGSPVELPWADKVSAILYAGLGGEAGAEAVVDVLEGAVNPSGKLPETWPCHAEDAPCMGWWGDPHRQAQYREGVYVGYRYFETAGQDVAFCFGHGLSYTS
jgi:beta-glucosidase